MPSSSVGGGDIVMAESSGKTSVDVSLVGFQYCEGSPESIPVDNPESIPMDNLDSITGEATLVVVVVLTVLGTCLWESLAKDGFKEGGGLELAAPSCTALMAVEVQGAVKLDLT